MSSSRIHGENSLAKVFERHHASLVVSNPALAESPNEPERMVIFERDRHTLWVLDSLD